MEFFVFYLLFNVCYVKIIQTLLLADDAGGRHFKKSEPSLKICVKNLRLSAGTELPWAEPTKTRRSVPADKRRFLTQIFTEKILRLIPLAEGQASRVSRFSSFHSISETGNRRCRVVRGIPAASQCFLPDHRQLCVRWQQK